MTDKEKFRKEVEKLKSNLMYGACSSQIAMETMCKEEAYDEVLSIIDSMQEEPVSIWHDASKKSDNPEDVVIINPSDNTGEVLTKCTGVNQGHIWAYTSELLKLDNPCNIGKNLQEPQVKESAEIQHVNDMCKENGNSLTQEPVNDELEKAAVEAFKQIVDSDKNNFLEIFKAGANWQKQQGQATIELAEDHAYFAGRTKTIDEIKEALLSDVLPYFMHGGEADEVVAKLDEMLNQKK